MARQLFDPQIPVTESGSTLRLELTADSKLSDIVSRVEQAHGKVISINPVRQTMEDYFFRLVGNERKFTSA